MSTRSLGTLTLDLVARTGGFVQGMSKAERESKKWRRQVERDLKRLGTSFKRMSTIAVAAAAAAAGGLALMVRSGLNAVDEQAKLARGLGGTVAGMQALDRAAGRAGVQSGELQSATLRLNQRLGQAVIEGGAAADALERIGLRAEDLIRLDVDHRMAAIADAMKRAGLNSQEMSFTLRELGIRQSRIVNLMQAGGDAIRDSRTAIEELGAAVSDIDAAAVERANDAMAEFGIIAQGVRNRLAVEFAPILEMMSVKVTDMVREAGGFGNVIASGMDAAVRGLAGAIEGASRFLSIIDEVVLGLQHIQRFQLQAEALGGTVNRIATGSTDDMPEAFSRLVELEADMARRRARIESGSPVAAVLRDFAAELQEIRAQQKEQQDSGELDEFGARLGNAGDALDDFGDALKKFTPSLDENVQDILDRAGQGSTIDAQGQIRDAFGNTLPSLQRQLDAELQSQVSAFESQANLQKGLERAAESFIDGAGRAVEQAWRAITPQSAGQFTPTGQTHMEAIQSMNQTVNQVAQDQPGRNLGTLHLTNDKGETVEVSGDAARMTRWLADALSGVALARG